MGWQDQPATQKQIEYLKQFGYNPDRPLTKGQASELISQFQEDPKRREIQAQNVAAKRLEELEEQQSNTAYYTHKRVKEAMEEVKRTSKEEVKYAKEDLKDAKDERLTFWKDSFRSIDEMESDSNQAMQFADEYGCRFKMPGTQQIAQILNDLDIDDSTWDLDHPELFFKALESYFPELLKNNERASKSSSSCGGCLLILICALGIVAWILSRA